jgi:hypothetical protein
MKIPRPYRGIEYSISDNGDGTWKFALHPKMEPNVAGYIKSANVRGTQDNVIAAVEKAIDGMLGPKG